MNGIKKLLEVSCKEYYLRLIEIIEMYPEARASKQNELAKIIVKDQKDLLKAVIEEIEEIEFPNDDLLDIEVYNTGCADMSTKISNLIKESIK